MNQANNVSPIAPPTTQSHPVDWAVIAWFSAVHAVALVGPWFFFSWSAVAAAAGLYFVTSVLGITLGFHRLLTHRSFKTPRWVERTLATLGVLAMQSSPLEWVGLHRMHHAYVDTPRDPHNARRGFWWSHLGWMVFINPAFRDHKTLRKYARDITADPYLSGLTNIGVQLSLQLGLALLLAASGGWAAVVWGIFVRLAVVYHVTWFVNSVAHKFGDRPHDSQDLSTNSWWVGLLAAGEGWHNNHHAFPELARAGHKWWELDLTYMIILAMEQLGLATDIKRHLDEVPAADEALAPVIAIPAAEDVGRAA